MIKDAKSKSNRGGMGFVHFETEKYIDSQEKQRNACFSFLYSGKQGEGPGRCTYVGIVVSRKQISPESVPPGHKDTVLYLMVGRDFD